MGYPIKQDPIAATAELFQGIREDDQKTVRHALNCGAKLDAVTDDEFKDTPLHLAARLNRVALGRLLMEKGASKEAKNAQDKMPWEVAQSIVGKAVFKNFQPVVPDNARDEATEKLFAAIDKDDLDGMRAAIKEGANVNYPAQKGRTPLHKAAIRGNAEAVQLLLDNKADHTAVDGVGYTAEATALLQTKKPEGTEGHQQCADILKGWREKNGGPEPKIVIPKKKPSPHGVGFEQGKGVADRGMKGRARREFSWRNTNTFNPPGHSK